MLLGDPAAAVGTYAGIGSVEPAARDAARGMGMTGLAGAHQGRGPLRAAALPQRSAQRDPPGHRHRTIAASVSLGGLGRYLIDGLASRDYVQMVCGSILVAVLALVADGVLALLENWAVSPESVDGPRVLPVHAHDTPIPTLEPDSAGADRPDADPRQAALVGSGSTGPVEATAVTGTPSERDRS